MFRPDQIEIATLDFGDRNAMWKLVCDTHTYYAERDPNMFMVDQLIAGIYDSRIKPAESFKLLLESYIAWMCIQDQGSKWNFAYLRKVFENKRLELINYNLQIEKEKLKAEAQDYRASEAVKHENKIKKDIAELYKLIQPNKRKFSEVQLKQIYVLIDQRKLLRANEEVDKVINK